MVVLADAPMVSDHIMGLSVHAAVRSRRFIPNKMDEGRTRMVSMTNKDFNRLLSAAYKLSSNWEHFKMELQDQDSVEDQMDRIKDILVKYNNRKVEEKLLHISSRKNNQPVICNGGIAHPRFFGCPRCGKDVGSYMITGYGPDEWSTHQDRFCSGCGLKIDWDGINFSDIMKV